MTGCEEGEPGAPRVGAPGVLWGRARNLATKLEALKPPDCFSLIRNDLSLPNEGEGHQAHRKNTKTKNDSHVRFSGGDAKGPV